MASKAKEKPPTYEAEQEAKRQAELEAQKRLQEKHIAGQAH